jgi:hypothetical protein
MVTECPTVSDMCIHLRELGSSHVPCRRRQGGRTLRLNPGARSESVLSDPRRPTEPERSVKLQELAYLCLFPSARLQPPATRSDRPSNPVRP